MTHDRDTIFALSSGRPPVAVAVIRVSGPRARAALETLAGRVPEPRRARLTRLRDRPGGDVLDEALILWFPAPNSETGEDVAELQVHGGQAVIAAVLGALGRIDGLRPAGAGELTPPGLRERPARPARRRGLGGFDLRRDRSAAPAGLPATRRNIGATSRELA